MSRDAPFEPANHLLDNPDALRQQAIDDGFLFFRGIVPKGEILALRRKVLQICDKYGWIAPGTDWMDGVSDPSADEIEPAFGVGVPANAYGDVQRLESFHRLAHHPNIIEMLAKLFDETVLVHPSKIARVMLPSKSNAPTPPHQDHIFIQGTKTAYTLWMPLGNCSRELGGLSLLGGSHKMGILPVRAASGAGGRHVILDNIEQEWFAADLEAGDALLFHSLNVHKSIPNVTKDRIRLSADFRYQPLSLPIDEDALLPHGEVLTWEQIYDDWHSTEFQFYWRKYELEITGHDMSLLEIQEG